MKRKLTLKAERLVELTAEQLSDVAGAQNTPLCVTTTIISAVNCGPSTPLTLCGCLTGDYSVAC
jgi:hypothetical protein